MSLSVNSDLYDLVRNDNGYDYDCYKVNYTDLPKCHQESLTNAVQNRDKKSAKRIANIKSRIISDINKNCFNKNYQVQCVKEYEILKEFCKTIDTKDFTLEWCVYDTNITTNQIYKILLNNCSWKHMIFMTRQEPVMHCYFYKKRNTRNR
jgi:hypothetical protein